MADSVREQVTIKWDALFRTIRTNAVTFAGATGASVAANGVYCRVSATKYIHGLNSAWSITYAAGTWSVKKLDADNDVWVVHFRRVNAAIAGAYVVAADGEGITPTVTVRSTGNYKTDLGANVQEWQTIPVDDDALPALAYKDTDAVEIFSTDQWKHTLTLDMLIYGNTPAQVRQGIADVITAIGTNSNWDGLTDFTQLTSENTGADQKNRKLLVANLIFTVEFITLYMNAYS